MWMPRRRRRPLSPHRQRDIQRSQNQEPSQPVLRHEEHSDPGRLQDRDAERIAPRRRAARGIRSRCAQPLHDQREPHDHVATHDGDVGRSRFEHGGDAGRQQQRARDLDEHQQPIRHIVAVVRGCEPGEGHPCPPDGEEHHQVTDETVDHVQFGHGVMQRAAACAMATTKTRSKKSSSGVAARCAREAIATIRIASPAHDFDENRFIRHRLDSIHTSTRYPVDSPPGEG